MSTVRRSVRERAAPFTVCGFPLVFSVGAVATIALNVGGETWLVHREGGSALVSILLATLAAGTIWALLLAHELGHALVARSGGATVARIRFHALGARTHLTSTTPGIRSAVGMVGAGPLVSAFSYAVLVGIAHVDFGWSIHAATIGVFSGRPFAGYAEQLMGFVLYVQAVVLVGSLIPALPMDGGRILIIGLSHWIDDIALAIKLAGALAVTSCAAIVIVLAPHAGTLIGVVLFLAAYALVLGTPTYVSLLRDCSRSRARDRTTS